MQIEGPIVDIAEIKRTLDEARCANGVARTTMMNLLVFCDDPEHEEWIAQRVEGIAKKYPARIILLDGTSLGDATTAILQPSTEAGTHSEIVRFGIRDCAPQVVRSLLDALCIPDVPEVLWWNGSTVGIERLFEELARYATPAILDSSGNSFGDESLRELLDLSDALGDRPPIDLAYLRIQPVQELLATLFDNASHRAHLTGIDRVHIEAGSIAEALYLAAWLSRVLAKEFVGDALAIVRDGEPRRVTRCLLQGGSDVYDIAIDESAHCANVTISEGTTQTVESLPFSPLDTMSLVEKALLAQRIEPHFQELLQSVERLRSEVAW